MRLSLSSAELARLEAATRVLLSPLDYPDATAWRTAINAELRTLLGAERASSLLDGVDAEPNVVGDFAAEDLRLYLEYYPELQSRYDRGRRAAATKVHSIRTLYGEQYDDYVRSAFYNEFLVPRRAFPSLGLHVSLGAGAASLIFHQPRPYGAQRERRDFALLRLLSACFESGVQTSVRLGHERRRLAEVLDRLQIGLLICDRAGRTLHANVALSRMLDEDPQREVVAAELGRVARGLLRKDASPAQSPIRVDIRTARAVYSARATYAGEDLQAAGADILISVERLKADPPSAEELRQRFGLTAKEAHVALLLAARRSNREIARHLSISPHTARHHTEHVMFKLGVHTRAEVGPRVFGEARA